MERLLHNYFLIAGVAILVGYFWVAKKMYRGGVAETLIYVAVLLIGAVLFFIGLARFDIP
jgi:FtsH-binding integral membrane protein